MTEIVLKNKKHGMLVLLLTILLLLVALVGVILGAWLIEDDEPEIGTAVFIVSLLVLCLGWIPLLGLRVLKPQEALVLTLFGK